MSAPLAAASATVTGLPVTDEARAPAAVRNGSAAVKQSYANAQSFEEMLMQQLSQSMLASSGLGGEGSSEGEEGSGEGGSSESSGALSSLLPQALTEGVMRQGGLGLADQLMRSLDPAGSSSAALGAGATPQAGAVTPSGGVAATPAANATGAPSGGVAATPANATGGVGRTGGVGETGGTDA